MAKSIQMDLVKGVSAKQHIEIHSMAYSGVAEDRHLSIQFARWGSKASYKAGERPVKMYRPLDLRGKALRLFKRQKNMMGAAWAMLENAMADSLPKEVAAELSLSAEMSSELASAKLEMEAGEQAFKLDMKEAG